MDIREYHDYFLSQNPEFDSLPDEDKDNCYFFASLIEASKKSGRKAEPLSKERERQMHLVCELLTLILKGDNLRFTIDRTMSVCGFIEVIGNNISITKPAMFAQAMQKAVTNLEVYPKTDGTIVMGLGFYNNRE